MSLSDEDDPLDADDLLDMDERCNGWIVRILTGAIRILSSLCLLGIGIGVLATVGSVEPLARQVIICAIGISSAALGVYVLVGDPRRRNDQGDDDYSV
jgi:hypothetical protein